MPDTSKKEDHIELTEYLDFTDAYTQIECFRDQVHQHKRFYPALDWLRPAMFGHHWRMDYAKPKS